MSAARDLAARTRLAFRHRGVAGVARRALSTPIRATPLGSRLFPEPMGEEHEKAVEWFAEHGRPVTVLVPVAAGRREAGATLRSVKRTTRGLPVTVRPVRGGPPALDAALRTAAGDAVVLQPEVIVHGGWLEMLQEAAYKVGERAAVSARELDGEGRVVSVGVGRDARRPGVFLDRYAGRPADHPPAEADVPVLAPSAGCLYLRRDALDRLGALDPELTGPWAPVDFGLRAWNAGLQVISHTPVSVTRLRMAPARGEDGRFWERWGAWLDARHVRSPSGGLRIAYVTEDTGIGGGHRVVFEHLNRLAARGHEPVLFALDGPPDWFDLRVPVRSFDRYEELVEALEPLEAIKVATWWNTALPVWLASVRHGIGAYFVQDIETSYYATATHFHGRVLASYREELRPLTTSGWNRDRLAEMGLEPHVVGLGIDLDTWREEPGVRRRANLVLSTGRTNPLKHFGLTVDAWRALDRPDAELRLFGSEPQLGEEHGLPYVASPSDDEVNRLYNEATVLVSTSTHEGFALPPLEAMAAGCAVVCTDAHGNRDFCVDGENCLMPEPAPDAVAAAIARLLDDRALRERLVAAGRETARSYGWEPRIEVLEAVYEQAAGAGPAANPTSSAS